MCSDDPGVKTQANFSAKRNPLFIARIGQVFQRELHRHEPGSAVGEAQSPGKMERNYLEGEQKGQRGMKVAGKS